MDYWGIYVENSCYADVLESVREKLGQYDISLTPLSNREDWNKSLLVINSPLDIHGEPVASLENLKPSHLALSPMLAAHPTDEIVAYASSPQSRAAIADLTIAILLYSLENCNAALPYFNKVRESVIAENSFMSGSGSFNPPLLDYIEFYKGNCALISGDYPSAIEHFREWLKERV